MDTERRIKAFTSDARITALEVLVEERDRLYQKQFDAAQVAVHAALAAQQSKSSMIFAVIAALLALVALVFGMEQ